MEVNPKRTVLVVVGPTASGKTSLSLLLGKELEGEIISADSRQVYKYLDIGTAKPNSNELTSIPHHFINILNPDQDYNAGEYAKQARIVIDEIFSREKLPIVVGGSGLYIQALIDGFFDGPSANTEVREKLYERLHNEGSQVLLDELRNVDPFSAANMLPSNTRRIIRALEVYQVTDMPISELHKSNIAANFNAVFVGLDWDRSVLYERINKRVELMFEDGLVEEVIKLQNMGYSSGLNSLQTVGYKEVFQFFRGEISLVDAKELIKRNTRRYAKRQLTWFRPDERITWFSMTESGSVENVMYDIKNYFNK